MVTKEKEIATYSPPEELSHEDFLSGLDPIDSTPPPPELSHEEFMGMDEPASDEPPQIIERFSPAYNRVLDYANRVSHIAFPQLRSGLETPQTEQDARTIASGAIGSAGALAGVPETTEAIFGIDTPVGRVSRKASDYVNKIAGEISPNDPDLFDSILSSAGSSLSFFVPGKGVQYGLQAIPKTATLLTKMAPAIGTGVMTVLESSAESSGVFKDMRSRGESIEDSAHAALKNFSLNTGLIGITNAFGVGSKEVDIFKKIVKSAPLEGLQEWWQSVFEDLSKDDPIDYHKANMAGGSGLIIGGVAGGVTSAIENNVLEKALDKFPGVDITKEEMDLVDESLKPEETTRTIVTEEQIGDTVVNETPPLIEPKEKFPLSEPTVSPPSAEVVGEDIEGVIEPGQMEELTRKTISEFNLDEETAKSLKFEGVVDRARLLRDSEIANQPKEVTIDEIREKVGQFRITSGERDILEEIETNVPKELVAEEGATVLEGFDPYVEKMKASGIGGLTQDSTTSDVLDVLRKAVKTTTKKPSIKSFIPDAIRQILEERQGETFTRVTPGIKKSIREKTGQVRPAEDPTITESEALKAQMEISEKASQAGFREGKKVGKESVKSAKQIVERRRMLVRALRDSLNLSDNDIRRVSKKDIRLMDNYEFKKFIDDLEIKAMEFAQKREDKIMVLSTLNEMNFKKVENLRKSLNLPSIQDMNSDQLQQFNEAMEQFQAEDEFLTIRALETLSKGELAGAKTIREVREIYAKRTGQNVDDIDNIEVGDLDKVRYDTALARQNPFYKILVDSVNAATLEGNSKFLDIENRVDDLFKKARESRKRTIGEKLIPSDERIFNYIEAPTEQKEALANEMTPQELDAAAYVTTHWSDARDYLIREGVLEKFIENYVTHTRRSFLEAFKEDGLIAAFKEILKQQEEDKSVFQILESDTGKILPFEKHFRFSMSRGGSLVPSKNVAKSFKTYMRAFYTKQAIDKINPAMMAYAYSLSKHNRTPRGLEMDRRLVSFVKEYLNNKQGRLSDVGFINQGGKIDRTLRILDAFVTVKDLGLNMISGLANQIGDPLGNVVALSPSKVARGVYRLATAKGQRIIEANRDFVGKSPWKDLSDVAGDIGSKFHKALFLMFSTASTNANKHYLLGSLTKEEWENGEISLERKAELLREMGEYRFVHGSRSIIGSTSPAKFFTKYLSWAIPVATTTLNNINQVRKLVQKGDSSVFKTKEFNQLFRQTIVSSFVLFAIRSMMDDLDDDDSFLGALTRRSVMESLSLISALNPKMYLAPRMLEFLKSLSIAVSSIPIAGYQYSVGDEDELEETVDKFKRATAKVLIPNVVSQFIPKDE